MKSGSIDSGAVQMRFNRTGLSWLLVAIVLNALILFLADRTGAELAPMSRVALFTIVLAVILNLHYALDRRFLAGVVLACILTLVLSA